MLYAYVLNQNGFALLNDQDGFVRNFNAFLDAFSKKDIQVTIPGLKDFKTKFLLSDYSSDRHSYSSALEVMRENYGMTLKESQEYIEDIDELVDDILLVRAVESLSREDLVAFYKEALFASDESRLSAEEAAINERENALIAKYKDTGLNYKLDKNYAQIEADRESLAARKKETKARQEETISEIETMSDAELSKRLIDLLDEYAYTDGLEAKAYETRKRLVALGLDGVSEEDLEKITMDISTLNSSIESRAKLEKVLSSVPGFFEESEEIKTVIQKFEALRKADFEYENASAEFDRLSAIVKQKESDMTNLNNSTPDKKKKKSKYTKARDEIDAEIKAAKHNLDEYRDSTSYPAWQKRCAAYDELQGCINSFFSKFNSSYSDYLYVSSSDINNLSTEEAFNSFIEKLRADITANLTSRIDYLSKNIDDLKASITDRLASIKITPDTPYDSNDSRDITVTFINDSVESVKTLSSDITLVRTTQLTASPEMLDTAIEVVNGNTNDGKTIVSERVLSLRR